jgi:hypothetical protein
MNHKAMYLLGTEAPDNSGILGDCGTPNRGYGDTSVGHGVEWNSDLSGFKTEDGNLKDGAAVRAQEEYNKAEIAYLQGRPVDAAFYLGAMAHYIGDISVYCHVGGLDKHHSKYESWMQNKTDQYNDGNFESYLEADGLVRRNPYTAVKMLSKKITKGGGKILSAVQMDVG